MRPPSSRVLTNRVDVYFATPAQDADAAPQFTYPAVPTLPSLPCSVQPDGYEELIDEQDRVTRYTTYMIMFGSYLNLPSRSRIVWVDGGGTTRTLFSRATRDEAGRGAAFTVRAVERV